MSEQTEKSHSTLKSPAPVCPACGRQMRLVGVGPDSHFVNLNIHDYVCDCGKDTSFLIARKE